jgi:hypothetical protein
MLNVRCQHQIFRPCSDKGLSGTKDWPLGTWCCQGGGRFSSLGTVSGPTLFTGGLALVHAEACHHTRLRSVQAACYSVPDGNGLA